MGDDRERLGDRPRDARIDTQPDSAKDGRARRCRSTLLAAASVQGMDFDSAIAAAVVQSGEEEVESRLDRLERGTRSCASSASSRRRTARSRCTTVSRITYARTRFSSRCVRRVKPRSAARLPSAWQLGAASRRSVSPTSRCCSKWRETACARPNIGTAPPRLLDGFTPTTNRRAWRSAGSACSRTSRTVQRARPPSSGCR